MLSTYQNQIWCDVYKYNFLEYKENFSKLL